MIKDIPIKKIFKAALASGADFAEIFAETSTATAIFHEDRRIERASAGTDSGFGLRISTGDRTVYGFTNDPALLIELACSLSASASKKTLTPAAKKQMPPADILDASAIKERAKLVERAASSAWLAGSEIKQVQVTWRDSKRRVWVVNSNGDSAEDKKTDTILVVHITAEKNGITQTGYEPVGGFVGLEYFIDHSPENIAGAAARRAISMLKAGPAPRGTMPVVISSEAGGTLIHEAVGHGLEADLVLQGVSVYKEKIGQRVASEIVTVVDDATIAKCRGTFAFDDEGTPAQRTVLIEAGILKSYMHNAATALKMGVKPTGNGRRESYRCRPIVRMTNTMIAPGKDDPADIIASVKNGLFIRRMGGGQVNTLNGDFVFEAQDAYLIENGKIGEPVRGATLIGNGPKVLMDIDMVGSDLGFGLGTCGKEGQGVPVGHGMPTIRVPQLTIGGK